MLNIYIFTAVFLFVFSLITFSLTQNDKGVTSLLKISILWLILYEGMRWEIGTDWFGYYNDFITQDYSSHTELGFVFFSGLVRKVTSSYTVFLLILTTFFYLVLYQFIKKYSRVPLMSLCIYYCIMLGLMGSNRQLSALFVCLLSLAFAFEKKFIPYFICLIIAFTLHTTSIVFFPAYFIINRHIGRKWLVLGCIIAIFVGLSGVVNNIPYINYVELLDANSSEKLAVYTSGDISAYSYFGTFKRLIIVIPCLILLNKQIGEKEIAFCKLYIIGAILYFIFNGSVLQLMAGRGALYYNITEILIIPLLVKSFVKDSSAQKLIWFAYFCFIVYVMLRDMNYYYLLDGVDIYRPYKSVLF